MNGTSDQAYWLANTRQLLLLVTCKVCPTQRIMHQSCWCLSWLVATVNARSNSWLQIPYSALLMRPTLFLRKLMQGLSHGSLGGKLRLSKPLPGAPSLSAKSAKSGMCQCTDAVCLDMRQPNEHASRPAEGPVRMFACLMHMLVNGFLLADVSGWGCIRL